MIENNEWRHVAKELRTRQKAAGVETMAGRDMLTTVGTYEHRCARRATDEGETDKDGDRTREKSTKN